MYQRQTVAQLFTTAGIRSHYRLGTNAKSLCKPSVRVCVCVHVRRNAFLFRCLHEREI